MCYVEMHESGSHFEHIWWNILYGIITQQDKFLIFCEK